jgi:hypothetical protein
MFLRQQKKEKYVRTKANKFISTVRKQKRNYDMQCCGSGMFIVYPGSRILIFTHTGSRISDPGSRIQKQQ